MQAKDLEGRFKIIGTNSTPEESTYKGMLTLTLNSEGWLEALWEVGGSQTQFGSGFYKNGLLVLNFEYVGEDGLPYYGVVAYKCLDADTLDGIWSEDFGDPLHVGTEKAYRIKENLLN